MIEITGLPEHPVAFAAAALAGGFAVVAIAKLADFVAARKEVPFRAGERAGDVRAEVIDWSDGAGYVEADGEMWRAVSKAKLAPGDEVRIRSVNGLTLEVSRRRG